MIKKQPEAMRLADLLEGDYDPDYPELEDDDE